MGAKHIDSLKEPKADAPQKMEKKDTSPGIVTKPSPSQERVGVSDKSGKMRNGLDGMKTDGNALLD